MSSVQSLERAFAILKVVADIPDGIGVTEAAQRVGLPKSTVSRLLITLEQLEAVERNGDSGEFQIGAGIFDLAAQASYPRYLQTVAQPHMHALAQANGEAVTLNLPENNQVHCLAQVAGQYNLQLQDWRGQYFPLYASADGKLYLAEMPPTALDDYLNQPHEAFTPHTLTDASQLRRQLATIRETGYAWTRDEYEDGLLAIACPIRNDAGKLVASISIGAPTFRFPTDEAWQTVIDLLRDAANTIAARL